MIRLVQADLQGELVTVLGFRRVLSAVCSSDHHFEIHTEKGGILAMSETFSGEHDERGSRHAVSYDEPRQATAATHQRHQSHVGPVVERRRPVAARPEATVPEHRQRPRKPARDVVHRRTSDRRPRSVVCHLTTQHSSGGPCSGRQGIIYPSHRGGCSLPKIF